MEKYTERLPDWILKILPVLTEYLSISDFEKWIYLPENEQFFPNDVYSSLISLDYRKYQYAIHLVDDIQGLDFIQKENLRCISEFLVNPLLSIDRKIFRALPIFDIFADYIWKRLVNFATYAHSDEELYVSFPNNIQEKIKDYLNILIPFLQNYQEKEIFHTILQLERECILDDEKL